MVSAHRTSIVQKYGSEAPKDPDNPGQAWKAVFQGRPTCSSPTHQLIPHSTINPEHLLRDPGSRGPLHEIRKQHPKPWPLPLRTEHSGKKTHQETVTTQSDKGHHERFQQRTRPVLGSWEGLPEERCELASKGGGRKRGGGDFTKRDEYMQESRSERPWGFRKGDREVQCGH